MTTVLDLDKTSITDCVLDLLIHELLIMIYVFILVFTSEGWFVGEERGRGDRGVFIFHIRRICNSLKFDITCIWV